MNFEGTCKDQAYKINQHLLYLCHIKLNQQLHLSVIHYIAFIAMHSSYRIHYITFITLHSVHWNHHVSLIRMHLLHYLNDNACITLYYRIYVSDLHALK